MISGGFLVFLWVHFILSNRIQLHNSRHWWSCFHTQTPTVPVPASEYCYACWLSSTFAWTTIILRTMTSWSRVLWTIRMSDVTPWRFVILHYVSWHCSGSISRPLCLMILDFKWLAYRLVVQTSSLSFFRSKSLFMFWLHFYYMRARVHVSNVHVSRVQLSLPVLIHTTHDGHPSWFC